jgi:hypothetical protein
MISFSEYVKLNQNKAYNHTEVAVPEVKVKKVVNNVLAPAPVKEKDVYDYAIEKNKIYTICTVPELYQDSEANYKGIHSIYIGDGIYIPALLNKLGLSEWITVDFIYNHIHMPNVRINSRNMTIYKYDNVPLVLQSSP